jgi:hypothetical protein
MRTEAQTQILALVDRHGASGLSSRTVPSVNVVHSRAALALVRAGILEEFEGADGRYVRRVPAVTPVAAEAVATSVPTWKRDSKDDGYVTTDETHVIIKHSGRRKWWLFKLDAEGRVGRYIDAFATLQSAKEGA